ncbi:transposase [Escherichia coli]|nr:transposase [Escherichia coli]
MNARKAVLADNPELILRVLQLRFDESLSYPRISAQTGISKTAIFSLVRRFHQVFTDWPLSGEYSCVQLARALFPGRYPSAPTVTQTVKTEKTRRNRFSPEFKWRLVQQTLLPGACVAQIARENGINDNLLFNWRHLWRNGGLQPPGEHETSLLPVTLTPEPDNKIPAPVQISPVRNMKMKPQYQTRYELLHESYQKWLTGFTRHAVSWGVCHPNIYYFHNLTPGWVSFNGEKPEIAIVPQSLHRLIYGPDKRTTPPLDDDLIVNLCTSEHLLVHHPMLEGILLSECERLRQRSLANKLISLFRQFGGTELRLKLVWLCWLDLMTGNCLDDWTENLKRKSEKELEEWIINRQKQSAALTDLMDQYVLLAYRTTVDDKRT